MAASRAARKREMIANLENEEYLNALANESSRQPQVMGPADVCRRLVDDKVSPSSWLDFRVDPQVVVDVGLVVEQAPPRGCLATIL